MTRTTLAALLALCVLAPALAGVDTRESTENEEEVPPLRFPEDKALPFDREKVPTQKPPLEAIDMKNAAGPNETERVDHPNVNDPGTTHAEGTEEGGRGSIRACTLPKLRDSSSNSSASDWLADSGNVTKVCHLPVQWLHGASGTLRVCSLPHDAWTSNITITDGTIPKELLAQLNTTGAKCVTPSEALSGNGSTGAVDSFANGSIPSAWLRDSNDTIYIYFIPQEWLRAGPPPTAAPAPAGPASEVEDLIKDDRDAAAPDPSAATGAPATVTAIAVSNATATATAAAAADTTTTGANASAVDATVAAATTAFPADVASNATGVGAAAVVSKTNSTTPAPSNSTNTATIAIAQATESNGKSSATIAPAVPPAASAIPTQKPKEETTNATDKPKENATKPVVMPKEITTKPSAKPTQEATKGTEKPATQTTLATKKPEEKVTEQAAGKTTEKLKDAAKPVQHSDAENEIGHGGDALHLPEALSQENSQRSHAESSAKTAFLQPTESAAILAGVFVAIALLGYAGLLLWRRVLEKRYGNREMLVNEDDDFDTSDMRHFEL